MIAQVIAMWLSGERGYWVTLTVLNVLKPDWVTTASRGIDRWIGTIVGVLVIGTLATVVQPQGLFLVIAVSVLVWVALAVEPVNYALYCLCVAGFVVLLLQVVDAQPVSSALYRAVDTTLGGVLAVSARALLGGRGDQP